MTHITPTRGDGELGFTLVELIVVVGVLGALAAVVVFAVGAVGAGAQTSGEWGDARTLALAQETFHAVNGRFGAEHELVAAGLLREESPLHDIVISADGDAYRIEPQAAAPTANPPPPVASSVAPTTRTVIYATGAGGLSAELLDQDGSRVLALVGDDAATSALWTSLVATPPTDADVVWFAESAVGTASTLDAIVAATDYVVTGPDVLLDGGATDADAHLTGRGRAHPTGYWSTRAARRAPTASEISDALGRP